MKCFLILMFVILTFSGCGGKKIASKGLIHSASVSSVSISNNQIIVSGNNLNVVRWLKINGASFDELFTIESKSSKQIIANANRAFSFDISKIFGLVLSDAYASATFPISFTLADKSITASKLSSMGAARGQVLKYDGTAWVASTFANSQTYIGTYNAANNTPNLDNTNPIAGDYYIVTPAGTYNTINYEAGDWIMYNGSAWEKVSNSTNVVSMFNGRRGIVAPTTGDYSWSMLTNSGLKLTGSKLENIADIDITGIAANKILKWDASNSKWIMSNDETSGGTNSVSSSEITDSAIVDADVNAAANIVATKLGTGAVDNTEFNYLDGVTSSIQTQLINKQPIDATLTSLATYNTNGILVQTAADTFNGRSITGTANRVVVTDGNGVAGNPTLNIDTAFLPSPLAGDAGKFLKASGVNASAWTALASSDVTTALGFTPVNKAGDSFTSGTFALSGTAALTVQDPVSVLDAANKQYVDSFGQWTKSGSDIYRSAGNVGIGATVPEGILDIFGDNKVVYLQPLDITADGGTKNSPIIRLRGKYDSDTTTAITSSKYNFDLINTMTGAGGTPTSRIGFINNGGTEVLSVQSSGNVGIGTTTPGFKFQVYIDASNEGHVDATGAWARTSDARYKKNITILEDSLQKILSLKPVRYDSLSDLNTQIGKRVGFLAQDLEKIYPEIVGTDSKGRKSVAYDGLISPIIKSIQELYSELKTVVVRVVTLENKDIAKDQAIASMIAENAELKQENSEIKARLDKIEKALSLK